MTRQNATLRFKDAEHAPLGITRWVRVRIIVVGDVNATDVGQWFVPEDEGAPPIGSHANTGPNGDIVVNELFFIMEEPLVLNPPFVITDSPASADFLFQVGGGFFSR